MDVEEAEKARRVGDLRREFAIYKAHLEDLFYNKAQVVAQLKKEEVRTCVNVHVHAHRYLYVHRACMYFLRFFLMQSQL